MVLINNSKTHKLGESVNLRFKITQHCRDEKLLQSFISYLGCGKYWINSEESGKSTGDFIVQKFSDLDEIIIPFLKKYPIMGVKALDFSDFCKVVDLIKAKNHLNSEGFKKIKDIKSGMNRRRDINDE